MAITAAVKDGVLDYNYTDKAAEKKAESMGSNLGYDQFLQLLCAEMQYQDPLEPTSNTDYVAQLATFSQLEATLGMQTTEENSMANSLVGKQVILKVESETTGKTTYVEGKVDYVMYENGETYLSVNDGLYNLDTLDTVADPDYYEAAALAKTFASMLGTLPDVDYITSAYSGAVQEVRDLYENMTSYQKQFVSEEELGVLAKLENRIAELKKADEAAGAETVGGETSGEGAEGEGETSGENSGEGAETI